MSTKKQSQDASGEPEAKAEPEAKPEAKAEPEAKPEARDAFYVVGPGSVMVGGELRPAGTELELTAIEAASLGASVARGRPPEVKPASARAAGRYSVKGPGAIWYGGAMREAGEELDLSADQARSLGDSIVEA